MLGIARAVDQFVAILYAVYARESLGCAYVAYPGHVLRLVQYIDAEEAYGILMQINRARSHVAVVDEMEQVSLHIHGITPLVVCEES